MKFVYTPAWDRQTTHAIDIEGVSPDDHVTRVMERTGTFYEHDLLQYLALRGPLGGLYVDAGSHIGNHAVYFGKFLADRVVCIEPCAELSGILERNLSVNRINDYVVIPCGLSSKTGWARVVSPPPEKKNSAMTKLMPAGGPGSGKKEHELVPVKTVDAVVQEVEAKYGRMPLRLLKVDVEGMQLEVLKGAVSVLSNHHPQLVVEAGSAEEKSGIDALLADYGYVAIAKFCATPTYHYIDPRVHRLRPLPLRFRFKKAFRTLRAAL